jgi:UDP-glucose 4-epimerase
MKIKKILITGGCGFIGANLISFIFEKTNWNITILDNLTSGKKEYLSDFIDDKRLDFIKGDIRDQEKVKKAIDKCDFVVNLAAQVGVIPSVEKPLFDMDVNIKGTLILLKAAVDSDVEKFIQASSATPLGEQEMPLNEDKVPAPLSPYGASKLACEGYCSAFSGSFNLNTVVLRFSNVYGPWSELKGSVIPLFIRQILNDETLTIYGDGRQTRDFIYVSDICQGIFLSLTRELPENYCLFQLGTEKETSINELIDLLKNNISKDFSYRYASARNGEIICSYTDISKAKNILRYKPKIPIEKGIRKTIEWFKRQKICKD